MLKQPLFIINFVLILTIGILHIVATEFFLYWSIPWIDIPIHFLGGAWVGVASVWFFFFSGFAGRFAFSLTARNIFTVSIASVIVIGILWEFFEIYAGVPILTTNYQLDTSVDLLMDTLGAAVASFYVAIRYTK